MSPGGFREKEASYHLELELGAMVSLPTCMVGTLQSSTRA